MPRVGVSLSLASLMGHGDIRPEIDTDRWQEKVLHAAHTTAHAAAGGLVGLAADMSRDGVSTRSTTLQNKVNPANDTHHLTLLEAVAMMRATGDIALLQAIAQAVGCVAVRAIPDESGGDPVQCITAVHSAVADLGRSYSDAMLSGGAVISRNEARRIARSAEDVHTAVGHLLGVMQAKVPAAAFGGGG